MEINSEDIYCLSEILETYNISLNSQEIKQLCIDFKTHFDMKSEMESYQHVSRSEIECEKCKSLKKEIALLESDIYVYQKNVIKRHHGSVRAYVENGNVLYDLV